MTEGFRTGAQKVQRLLPVGRGGHPEPVVPQGLDHGGMLDDLGSGAEGDEDPHGGNTSTR